MRHECRSLVAFVPDGESNLPSSRRTRHGSIRTRKVFPLKAASEFLSSGTLTPSEAGICAGGLSGIYDGGLYGCSGLRRMMRIAPCGDIVPLARASFLFVVS